MNGGEEIDKNELLDTLERITPAQFAKLVFKLEVPKNLMPAEDKEPTLRAIALLEWAKAPGGCGLKKIRQALGEMEITLGKLPCTSQDPNHIYKIAETKLLNFDHRTTLKTFIQVVEQLEMQESAGIFVLPNCWSQGGKYCHRRLIYYLKTSTAEGKFHLFNVNYLSGEMSLKGLVYCFASVLKTNQNLENLTEKDIINIVITKIHDLVPEQDSGRTYLFHIKGYDSLLKDKNFWKWFVEHFWGCLIQKLPDITKKHPCLKLIFLFESEIDVEVEPNYIYSFPEAFTQTKIVNLPLEPCDMGEIRTWLYKFSCLPQSIIDQILDILQQVTDRKPHQVYDLFRDKLIQHLQNV